MTGSAPLRGRNGSSGTFLCQPIDDSPPGARGHELLGRVAVVLHEGLHRGRREADQQRAAPRHGEEVSH